MIDLASGALTGSAFWILTHAWCHRRYLAMDAGDLEEIAAESPSQGLSGALQSGIELGTVSPHAARLARDRGILAGDRVRPALSGAYRRHYDPTLSADIPWLPLYLGMAMIGSMTSTASAMLLSAVASAAQCDSRFRVIPTALALAIVPLGVLAVPAATGAQVAVRAAAGAGTFAIAAMARAVARRGGANFGTGDLFLIACPVATLAGSPALMVFLASLTAELAVRAVWGRRAAAAGDIPLAAHMTAPMALAYLFM